MPTISNIIELRRHLAERMPAVRVLPARFTPPPRALWATGLDSLDNLLGGGLPKGALSEVVCPQPGTGGALLLRTLLHQAARQGQWAALIDGQDSFDLPETAPEAASRWLWVRCTHSTQALQAADLLVRDGNLPLVLLDLQLNAAKELQKVPPSLWYRFQRIVRQHATVLLTFTPRPLVSAAAIRLQLQKRFPLSALDGTETELLRQLEPTLLRGHCGQEDAEDSLAGQAG